MCGCACRPDKKLIQSLVALELRGELHENMVSTLWPSGFGVKSVKSGSGQQGPGRTASGQESWAVQKGEDDIRVVLCQVLFCYLTESVVRRCLRYAMAGSDMGCASVCVWQDEAVTTHTLRLLQGLDLLLGAVLFRAHRLRLAF